MATIRDFLPALPHPTILRNGVMASAILDTIIFLKDDQKFKHNKFHSKWPGGAELFEYDSGGGDDIKILFFGSLALIKGFDHESDVSPHARDEFSVWEGIYDGVPDELNSLLESIEKEDVTFCVWFVDGAWQCGSMSFPNNEDDGAEGLLSMICLDGEHYEELAADYHDRNFHVPSIEAVFSGEPISEAIVSKLNPDCDTDFVFKQIENI